MELQKTWTGPYIRPEWRLLAELRVAQPGRSIREIALEMGLNYQSCLMWTKKVLYQQYEAWLVDKEVEKLTPETAKLDRATLRQKYLEHAQDMQDRLLTIIETTSDAKLQADLAQDWLDRADLAAPKKEEKQAPIYVIPDRMLEALFTRAQEAGLIGGTPGFDNTTPDNHLPASTVKEGEVVGNP